MIRRAFALLALSAVTIFAQGPGRNRQDLPQDTDPQTRIQMRVARLAVLLGLSDEQKTKATAIFTEAYAAGENTRTAAETARTSLNAAVKANDAAAIDRLSAQLGSLHGQSLAIHSKAEAAFYALLTADQKAKFDALPQRGEGGGRGPR